MEADVSSFVKFAPSTNSLRLAIPLFGLLFLAGCAGAAWGNLIVLGVTFGIFIGTLSLGRSGIRTVDTAGGADRSAQG